MRRGHTGRTCLSRLHMSFRDLPRKSFYVENALVAALPPLACTA